MRVVSLTDDQHELVLKALRAAWNTQGTELTEIGKLYDHLLLATTIVRDEQDPILLSIAAVDRLLAQAQEIIKERLTAP